MRWLATSCEPLTPTAARPTLCATWRASRATSYRPPSSACAPGCLCRRANRRAPSPRPPAAQPWLPSAWRGTRRPSPRRAAIRLHTRATCLQQRGWLVPAPWSLQKAAPLPRPRQPLSRPFSQATSPSARSLPRVWAQLGRRSTRRHAEPFVPNEQGPRRGRRCRGRPHTVHTTTVCGPSGRLDVSVTGVLPPGS